MKTIVHSPEDLVLILRRGLNPITDNRDALLELGFQRAYPQIHSVRESTIWERSIEHGRTADGFRQFARERAFLVAPVR
jgi:hypothetical protein